jgi:SAM-dependent methyltransferase
MDPETDFDAYARKLWAGRGGDYDRGLARLTAYPVGALLDAARVGPGTRLLDVGTGTGVVAGPANARGARVTAVDAEPSMVEIAARNVPGLDVRLAVLPALPLPDGDFDAVVGNFVINAVADPVAALAELRRVLREGGRLALTCWRYPLPAGLTVIADALEAAGVPWPDDVPEPPFRAYASPEAFAGLLTASGFTEVAAEPVVWEHRIDPQEWWAVPLSGVGSTGFVLRRQDPATIARVKEEFDRLVTRYATGDGRIALPAAAVLARATR